MAPSTVTLGSNETEHPELVAVIVPFRPVMESFAMMPGHAR